MPSNKAALLLLLPLIALFPGCVQSTVAAAPQSPEPNEINFLSIVVDQETEAADKRLKKFLEKAVGKGATTGSDQRTVRFQQQTMPYGDVIRAFAERDPNRGYLARITPYAYVAAEMLGAKLNILAVYQSAATHETTYHSYFVVRKDTFRKNTKWKSEDGEPSLEDIVTYLKSFEHRPAKFMYHDRFSTSSYFLPSLYFKSHDVFAMTHSLNPHLIPIEVERLVTTSSSELVKRIVDGKADLVAVWDGTKKKFENDNNLLFITIPTAVPNDFLVASGISERVQRLIVDAIKGEPAADRQCTDLPVPLLASTGSSREARPRCEGFDDKRRPRDDFDAWHAWDTDDSEMTDLAREALARLRQDARQQPTPVVVRVEGKPSRPDSGEDEKALLSTYVNAAKEAVRLSGTEFVLEDRDLHKRVDMTWTLESTHDGALTLTSKLDSAFGQSDEPLPITFVDRNDLPRRIADLARSRLRRIRYVWPYEQKYPAVLRDLDFTPDQRVQVQKISWLDPERNEYEEDTPFDARIENNTDFSKLRLSDEIKFPRNPDGSFNFDPMSNIAYRVVIAREPHAGWFWVMLPYCFIGLFAFAGAGLAFDLRRRQPPPKGLQQTYQRMVESYHRPWRDREIEEGEILWCDSAYLDVFVREFKKSGSLLDIVQAGGFDFNFGPIPVRFSILMKLGSCLCRRRPQLAAELFEAAGGGSVAALDSLIQFLVCRRRLSPFVGFPEHAGDASRVPAWPIEWEALNDIASRHFQQLGICDKPVDAHFGTRHTVLSPVVSAHFRGVLKKATHDASLFRQTWTVREHGSGAVLDHEAEMASPVSLTNDNGSTAVSKVRVEVNLPAGAVLSGTPANATLQAWVFGRILNWSMEHGTVALHVRPIAIVRDYDHQH
jgi:ABC-type phosphate/phosphonate transport system substrate-binding protein